MAKKSNTSQTVDQLVASIIARSNADPFGIATAAAHMKSLLPCFEASTGGLCPKIVFGLSNPAAWEKALKDAEKRLTYCAADMLVSEIQTKDIATSGLATPNAIAEFDHVVTSTRKDFDGDILESSGGSVEHCKALLWQHIPVQPIGVFLGKTAQNTNLITGRSAIVGTMLGKDAAVLTEAGALRISHGFKPGEYEPLDQKSGGRWRIKTFDIMEVSLVSVPANADAVVTAFSRKSLEHPLVNAWAGAMFKSRPVMVQAGIDLAGLQTKSANAAKGAATDTTPTGSSIGGELPKGTDGTCPQCGRAKLDSTGTCEACGHVAGKSAQDGLANKAGRVLSAKNEAKIKQIASLASELLASVSAAADDMDADDGMAKAANDLAPAAGLQTKSTQELATKGYYSDDNLDGSYESIRYKLSRTAKNYLLGKGVSVGGSDAWVDIVATYDGKAVVCAHSYGSTEYPCYQMDWKLVNGKPSWDGDPKAVKIQTTVVEKLFAEATTKAAKLGAMPVPQQPTKSISEMAADLISAALKDESNVALKALRNVGNAVEVLESQISDREMAAMLS